MTLTTYPNVIQGTPEWDDLRRGMVTASSVGQLVTVGSPEATAVACPACAAEVGEPCISTARKAPTPIKTFHGPRADAASTLPQVYRVATNDTARALTLLLTAERITGHTEPTFLSEDMMRGLQDEPRATAKYSEHFAPVAEMGFMVRDDWGFSIGYSPDGLVGDEGCIEIKSRRQKKHLKTVVDDVVPPENYVQCQAALLVSGRSWLDYLSYCGGMRLYRIRVEPDLALHAAIVEAVAAFETNAAELFATYTARTEGLPTTERADLYEDLVI